MDADSRVAELAAKDARIAEQDARIAEQDARIAELTEQLAKLTKQVAELTERLGRNSSNSNKPPSSDPPSNRAERRAQQKRDRRRAAVDLLRDVVGVQISLGALSAVEARVSDAVKPAVDQAWTQRCALSVFTLPRPTRSAGSRC